MKTDRSILFIQQRAGQLIAIRKDEDIDSRLRCCILCHGVRRSERYGECHERDGGDTTNAVPPQPRQGPVAMRHLFSSNKCYSNSYV
jgi:hypothetical protein